METKRARAYLDDCRERKVIFFTGKGGVGKSTVAWATAVACHKQGLRVTVAGWNPLESSTRPFPNERTGVQWLALETLAAFREYALQIFKFETLYHVVFDNHVLKTFIRAAPGLAETVVAGKIWDLYQKREQDLLIVDLPSSGHAVSFFQSPLGVHKLFAVGFVHKEAEKICGMFQSEQARVDLVSLPEELPMVEGLQLKRKLEGVAPLHFGFLHVNQCTPAFALPAPEVIAALPEIARECCERHERTRALEQEALKLAEEIGLAKISIPRFPSASLEETLEKTARFLEEA